MDDHATDSSLQSDTVQQLLRSAVSAPTWVSALTLASHLTSELVSQLQTGWSTFDPAARVIVCLAIACIRPIQLKELSHPLAKLLNLAVKDTDDWVNTLARLFRKIPATGRIDLADVDQISIINDRIEILSLQLKKGVQFTRDEEAYLNHSTTTVTTHHLASTSSSAPLASIRSSEGVTTRSERQKRFQMLSAVPVNVTAITSSVAHGSSSSALTASPAHHSQGSHVSPSDSNNNTPGLNRARTSVAGSSGGSTGSATTSAASNSTGLFIPRRAPPPTRPGMPKQTPSFLRTGVQRPRPINTSTRVTTTGGSIISVSAGGNGVNSSQSSPATETATTPLASPMVPVTPGGRETRMQMLDIAEGAAIIRSVEDEKTRKLQDEAREKELRMQKRRQEMEQRRIQEAEEKRRRIQERNDKRERKRQKSIHNLREREAEERAVELRLQEEEAERQRELALDSQIPPSLPIDDMADSSIPTTASPCITQAAIVESPPATITITTTSSVAAKASPISTSRDNTPPSSIKRAKYDLASDVSATSTSYSQASVSATTVDLTKERTEVAHTSHSNEPYATSDNQPTSSKRDLTFNESNAEDATTARKEKQNNTPDRTTTSSKSNDEKPFKFVINDELSKRRASLQTSDMQYQDMVNIYRLSSDRVTPAINASTHPSTATYTDGMARAVNATGKRASTYSPRSKSPIVQTAPSSATIPSPSISTAEHMSSRPQAQQRKRRTSSTSAMERHMAMSLPTNKDDPSHLPVQPPSNIQQYRHPSISVPSSHVINEPAPLSSPSCAMHSHSMQHMPSRSHATHPGYEQPPHPHHHLHHHPAPQSIPPHDYLMHSNPAMGPPPPHHGAHPMSANHRQQQPPPPPSYGQHTMAHPTSTPPPPAHSMHHGHHTIMPPTHPHATPPAHNYHYLHPPGPSTAPVHGSYSHPPPSNVDTASAQSKELLNWIELNANCIRPDERLYIESFVMGDRSVPLPRDATVPIYQVVLREERQQDPHTGMMFQVRVVLEMAVDTMRWRQLQMRTPCQ